MLKNCTCRRHSSFGKPLLSMINFVMNRVGIDIPKIEVRYENLSIEGDAYVGSRALPTLFNATINVIEVFHLLAM